MNEQIQRINTSRTFKTDGPRFNLELHIHTDDPIELARRVNGVVEEMQAEAAREGNRCAEPHGTAPTLTRVDSEGVIL